MSLVHEYRVGLRATGTMRRLSIIVLAAAATTCLAACFGIRDPVPNRELACGALPDELCIQVANLAMSPAANLDRSIIGSPMTVEVKQIDCADIGRGPDATRHPPATRCWRVDGDVPGQSYGFGRWIYERPDGSLGVTG